MDRITVSGTMAEMERREPPAARPAYLVVAVAASAGGPTALARLLATLPAGFPAAILVVQHLAPHLQSCLSSVLARQTALRVREAREGEKIQPGVVYLAPPDKHLLVDGAGTLSLSGAEAVHYVRPSADVLFGSLAQGYGKRGIAVVLTGNGMDGAQGIGAVKAAGGCTIAQDEDTSAFPGMPHAAAITGDVDHILPIDRIPGALVALVTTGDIA